MSMEDYKAVNVEELKEELVRIVDAFEEYDDREDLEMEVDAALSNINGLIYGFDKPISFFVNRNTNQLEVKVDIEE